MRTLLAIVFAALVATAAAAGSGCSDGTREGYLDEDAYPAIAACSGAWSIRGISLFAANGDVKQCGALTLPGTRFPACERKAGNNGEKRNGAGCNVADICAEGWHVCVSEAETRLKLGPNPSCQDAVPAGQNLFFATRQSSNGCGKCSLGETIPPPGTLCNSASCQLGCINDNFDISNDVFGCGTYGGTSELVCGVLNRFSHNLCSGFAGTSWHCNAPGVDDDNGLCETFTVLHDNPDDGGVLCCKDGGSPNSDDDLIPDPDDNCPGVPNDDQADCNHNGRGDACDPIPCGFACDCDNAEAHSSGRYVELAFDKDSTYCPTP